eukprot:COSAG03_NODE_974_length_5139_cov_2.100397_7_plen_614_part_00
MRRAGPLKEKFIHEYGRRLSRARCARFVAAARRVGEGCPVPDVPRTRRDLPTTLARVRAMLSSLSRWRSIYASFPHSGHASNALQECRWRCSRRPVPRVNSEVELLHLGDAPARPAPGMAPGACHQPRARVCARDEEIGSWRPGRQGAAAMLLAMGTSLWLGLAGLGSLPTTSVTSAVEAAVAGTAAPSELLLNRDTGGRVLDRAPPTFTWRPPSDLRCGSKQTAYQLRLVDAAGAMVVDTGRVPSAASTNVALPRAAGELRAGRHYSWSVKVWATEHDQPNAGMATSGKLCESESAWSRPSAFRTAIWDGFAATTQAVWTPGKARYALFRQEIAVPEGAKNATCYVTALVGGAKQKLLGAYRLYVNGASAGIGPGRGDCSLEYKGSAADKQLCTEHDTIDLSDHLPAAGGKLTIGLQSYHEGGSGAVKLQLHFETDTAEVVQVGTNSSWLSHDATAYFNPFSATGGYNAPRENQNASAYAGAWQHSDYHPPTGVAWSPSVVQDDFPATAVAKTGLPLSITTGVVPPVLIRVEQSSDDALFFFDQTSEVMGGVHLEVPVGASGGYKYAEVTLSEELDGLYGSGALLYPMRTGNRYRYLFSLDPSIRSVFDIHE